jgi:hypothetical protein
VCLQIVAVLAATAGGTALGGDPTCVSSGTAQGCHEEITGGHQWTLENDEWKQTLQWDGTALSVTEFGPKGPFVNWILPGAPGNKYHFAASGFGFEVTTATCLDPYISGAAGPGDNFTYQETNPYSLVTGSGGEEFVELVIPLQCIDQSQSIYEVRLAYRARANGALESFVELQPLIDDELTVDTLTSFLRTIDTNAFPGGPAWYRWVNYPLGTENPVLNSFVVEGHKFVAFEDFPYFALYEVGSAVGLTGGLAPAVQVFRPFSIRLSKYVDRYEIAMDADGQLGAKLLRTGPSAPHPTYRTATAYLAFFDNSNGPYNEFISLSNMGQALQAHQLDGFDAPWDPDFPRIQYNNYFRDGMDFDFGILQAESDEAADIGVERLVIDAGWWQGSPQERSVVFGCYRNGAGHWFGSECKFPQQGGSSDPGFRDLMDYFVSNGQQPGLWVYPFGVDETFRDSAISPPLGPLCWDGTFRPECYCVDASTTPQCTKWNDDWKTDISPSGTCSAIQGACGGGNADFYELCSSLEASHDWVLSAMNHLVDNYDSTYLKIDGGVLDCDRDEEHGHHTNNGIYESNHQGLNRLLSELRAANPSLVIEAEWPAGQLAFLEDPMEPHTIQAWETRYGQESVRWFTLANYTMNYLYGPPEWNGICRGTEIENHPICANRGENLEDESFSEYWVRSRMLGGFAISPRCDDSIQCPNTISLWPTEFRDVVAEHAQFFKDNRRFYGGKSFTLISQKKECANQGLSAPCTDSWDAVEFLDETAEEALVFAFRNDPSGIMGASSRTIKPKGLNTQDLYQVIRYDGTVDSMEYDGGDLMAYGYMVLLGQDWTSDILLFKKVPDCGLYPCTGWPYPCTSVPPSPGVCNSFSLGSNVCIHSNGDVLDLCPAGQEIWIQNCPCEPVSLPQGNQQAAYCSDTQTFLNCY